MSSSECTVVFTIKSKEICDLLREYGFKIEDIYGEDPKDTISSNGTIIYPNGEEIQPATMPELLEVLDRGALSAVLTPAQKNRKVSNLLQKMKAEGSIVPEGPRNRTKWHLVKNDKT